MRTLIVRTIMALCLCSVLSSSAGAQRIGNNNEERARFLLGQLETRLAKIRNFRCRKVTPQFVLQDGAEQEIASYSSAWLASDQQGRGRIRTTSPQAVDTQIWDGEKTIEHRQEIAADGKITHTVFAAPGKQYDTQRQDEPWIYLGRDLARLVTDALEKGHRLRVVQASDGMFRVDVRDGDGGLHSYVVDPQKGYMPVHRRIRANGEVQILETITLQEVDPLRNPGVWFPVAVHSQAGTPGRPAPEVPILKCQFADVVINDDRGFANALTVQFAEGTEVRDRATGQVYTVGQEPLAFLAEPGPVDVNDTPAQPAPDVAAWRTAFEAVYRLEDGQVLKCISAPFTPERATYLQEAGLSTAGRNEFYCFVWDDALGAPEHLGEARALPLATVIERVIGLSTYEYEALPHVLRLRLEGDWVVRKDAPTEQLLAALGPIVKDQTQWSLDFAEQLVDAIVIRSSGTYRFNPQPETGGASGVHIYAGDWGAQRDALGAGSDCGTVATLLDHVADRIGMPIINGTQSPDVEVCWATHESSQLHDQRSVSSFYNTQLASLLTNLTHQTGLTFSMELGSIARWHVSTQRGLAARSN